MTHVLVQLRNEFTMSAQTVAGLTCCPTRGAPFYTFVRAILFMKASSINTR